MNFTNFPINKQLLHNLSEKNFTKCSDIQGKSIEPIINKQNVIACAPTGTGKTLAFVVPTLHNIIQNPQPFSCLILAPTRELAIQIDQEIFKITQGLKVRSIALYGQESIQKQIDKLRRFRPQIIVATCGRLLDHLQQGTLDISGINIFILDEADEMLKMGFREDIYEIINEHPHFDQVQKLLFSATINDKVYDFAKEIIPQAQYIKTSQKLEIVDTIDQYYVDIEERDKINLLEFLLNKYHREKIIIFVNRKSHIEQIAKQLNHFSYQIHGDLRQFERNRIINYFKNSKRAILIASDVAARGLDIRDVEIVINYNYPPEDEFYIHRIGRSGRNHKKGLSITFISDRHEQNQLFNLIKTNNSRIKKYPLDAQIASALMKDIRNFQEDRFHHQEILNSLQECDPQKVIKVLLNIIYDSKKFNPIAFPKSTAPLNHYQITINIYNHLRNRNFLLDVQKSFKIKAEELGKMYKSRKNTIILEINTTKVLTEDIPLFYNRKQYNYKLITKSEM